MREWVGHVWIPHKASFFFREADPAREFGIAGVEPVVRKEVIGLDGGRRIQLKIGVDQKKIIGDSQQGLRR
jgi:hypothetical protein